MSMPILLLGLCWIAPAIGDGPRTLDEAVGRPTVRVCDDPEFFRRISLDLIGRIPSVPEVRAFLDDPSPSKRSAKVESLIASDEFDEHWGRLLAEWLTDRRAIFRVDADGEALSESLASSIRRDRPYPEMARDVVVGSGSSEENGSVNFLLRYDTDPIKLAGGVGKNLMGVTIQCAQCHHHPFARWQQDDFWGLAAVFARIRQFSSDEGDRTLAVLESPRGELRRPDPSAKAGTEPMPTLLVRAQLPDGTKIPAAADRRRALGDWLASAENPYVARNLVNRAWAHFFGKALIKNLDDPGKATEAMPVLEFLAADFGRSGYSLKALARAIALSRTYAQSTSEAEGSSPSWSRPVVRPIPLDPLYASIAQATGYEADRPGFEDEDEIGDDEDGESPAEPMPAPELPFFQREDDPAAERLGERPASLQRALVFMNGEHLREAVRSGARVCQAVLGPKIGHSHVEWAFLATLGRKPTEDESARMARLMARDRREGLEDVFWVLLNSAEFQTNH
ncbi:MAG: DUF1549 domain-containing protein [Isosphaeraceae bacterium]